MAVWFDQSAGRNREENGNLNYETYENVKGKRITLESAYAIIRKNIIRKIR